MDFNVIESSDAIRLTFNAWPHSKLEATRCVLPLAAMYTPNKVLPNMPVSFWRLVVGFRRCSIAPGHQQASGARGHATTTRNVGSLAPAPGRQNPG